MTIKQILILFWWIIAISVIMISAFKINSLKLETKPTDVSRDIALIANRIGTSDMKVEVTYFLEKDTDVIIKDGNINFLSKSIVVESYPAIQENEISITKKEDSILIKNG